jgi:hypothetical protein
MRDLVFPVGKSVADGNCVKSTGELAAERSRKDPICLSPYRYRARNLVERFFNGTK